MCVGELAVVFSVVLISFSFFVSGPRDCVLVNRAPKSPRAWRSARVNRKAEGFPRSTGGARKAVPWQVDSHGGGFSVHTQDVTRHERRGERSTQHRTQPSREEKHCTSGMMV